MVTKNWKVEVLKKTSKLKQQKAPYFDLNRR